jgi:adenylate cyclase
MDNNKLDANQMWHDWFMVDAFKIELPVINFFRLLPHDPRCKLCYSPFDGVGGFVLGTLLGRKRSSLNPNFCSACEDFAKKNPGGSEVEMSMLFVDIRGSTALSETMSPAEFSRLINQFFVQSTDIIVAEDGLIEKLAGDAVAAFWGAGFAGPDYVNKTIRSAQNILRAMHKENIPVGIGIHSGIAFFGAMGSAGGLVNIAAIGEEVNTAARLASKAAAGEIIISEQALKSANMDGAALESRQLDLKGISEPVSVRVMCV